MNCGIQVLTRSNRDRFINVPAIFNLNEADCSTNPIIDVALARNQATTGKKFFTRLARKPVAIERYRRAADQGLDHAGRVRRIRPAKTSVLTCPCLMSEERTLHAVQRAKCCKLRCWQSRADPPHAQALGAAHG